MSDYNLYNGGHAWEERNAELDRAYGLSQPETLPVGPWIGGDSPHIPYGHPDPQQYLQELGAADVIWRDMEARAAAANALQQNTGQVQPTPYTPPTIAQRIPQSTSSLPQSFTPRSAPKSAVDRRPSYGVAPSLAHEPVKELPQAEPKGDSRFGIVAAAAAIACVTGLGILSVQDNEKVQSDQGSKAELLCPA